MKKLSVIGITDSAQLKIKTGTLQFLQDANYEAFQAIVIGAIGANYSATTAYIIYGVKNSGSGLSYNISAGAIFYGGEIYLVDAVTFTASGSQVAVLSIVTTQYTANADPVTLTDSSVLNVHNIRKIVISAGTSGSTIADFSAISGFSFYVPAQLNLIGTGQASVSGTYPNMKVNVPAATNLYPALYAGSFNIGNVPAGSTADYPITFPALTTANYYVVGMMVSNPTSTLPNEDVGITWGVRARTSTGFIVHVREMGAWTQDISFEYILYAK